MKKVIVLSLAIFAFAANNFAQEATQTDTQKAEKTERMKKHRGGNAKHAAAKDMKKELNLTSNQSTRMKNVSDTYKGKMKALKTDNSLSKDQKKAQMTEIHKSHDAEIKGILNADQYTKFSEMKKQHPRKKNGDKGEHKGHEKKQGDTEPAPKSN